MDFVCSKPGCEFESDTQRGISIHETKKHSDKSKLKVECYQCGNVFEKYKSEAERRSDKNFCNNDCYGEYTSERQSGRENPQWEQETKLQEHKCQRCGTEYMKYAEADKTSFCSKECYSQWMSENRIGEDSPAYKKDISETERYGNAWEFISSIVRNLHGNSCNLCHISNEEHKTNFGRSLSVHHLAPDRTFRHSSHSNKIDNLIPLCSECHHWLEPK